ncbi:MAG: hypothetical protein KC619_21230, partial [Myxococcales bacterium]|nr:hypothetical protein [Myxococcales bacterium]
MLHVEVEDRLVVAADRAADRRVLARFIGSREVEDPGNRQFPTLDRLRRDVPEAAIAASTNSLSAHKAMALAGLGVAILPEPFVRAEIAAGSLVALYPDEPLAFPVLRIARTGMVWSAADRAYLEAVDAALA